MMNKKQMMKPYLRQFYRGNGRRFHALDETLLKHYDCVLTLKNGRITESGSFDELMAKKGYFYSLFTISQ